MVLGLELHRAFSSLLNIAKRKIRVSSGGELDLEKCITSFKLSSMAEKDYVPLANNVHVFGVKGGKVPISNAVIAPEAIGLTKITPISEPMTTQNSYSSNTEKAIAY